MRATSVIHPPDERLSDCDLEITLTREDRYRRRVLLQTDDGRDVLLDLENATYLPNGAGLVTDQGDVIKVRAASEELMEITAPLPLQLAKITWHIGNRHTPAEITEGAIYIQSDHVLADMVRGLGGDVRDVKRPFEPEGGAYGHHGSLEHGHHHHGHGHGHGSTHTHTHNNSNHD